MPECKHEEISRILAEEITGKLYSDRFPPVRSLAARFQVSTRTMTKALKPLIQQGLIIPEGPRGCRVAKIKKAKRSRTDLVGIFAGIGKIVPAEDPLLAPLLEYAKSDGYTPLLTDVPRPEKIRDPEFWRSSYIDGYIFVYSSFNLQLANQLKADGIPFVVANRLADDFNANWADFDHFPAMCELYKQLKKSGAKRIALLDKPSFSNSIAYSTAMWERIQECLAIPQSERGIAFGNPVANEDYSLTLTNILDKFRADASTMPDAVIARNAKAGRLFQELVEAEKLPVKVVITSGVPNWQPPYDKLASAVWELFKKARDNGASFAESCEIPYSIGNSEK